MEAWLSSLGIESGVSYDGRIVHPAQLGKAEYSVVGEATVDQRIQRLFRAVTLGVMDPAVRVRVMQSVKHCPSRGEVCELETGFYQLRREIAYRKDPPGLDLFQTYQLSLELGGGDCGSMSAAMRTHACVLGYQGGVTTIAQPDPETGIVAWSHVFDFELVGIERRRMAFDISEPGVPAGWEPQRWRYRAKRDWLYDSDAWASWYFSGAKLENMPNVR